jgi:hypothetical protein
MHILKGRKISREFTIRCGACFGLNTQDIKQVGVRVLLKAQIESVRLKMRKCVLAWHIISELTQMRRRGHYLHRKSGQRRTSQGNSRV